MIRSQKVRIALLGIFCVAASFLGGIKTAHHWQWTPEVNDQFQSPFHP